MKRNVISAALCLRQLLEDESGQDLIEYALVAALVGLGAVASLRNLSTKIVSIYAAVTTSMSSAV